MNKEEKKVFYKKLWFWYFVVLTVVAIVELLDRYIF